MTKDAYELEKEELLAIIDEKEFTRAVRIKFLYASPLFGFLTPTRHQERRADSQMCGCPLMIRGQSMGLPGRSGWTDELTRLVAGDTRIPCRPQDVTRESLDALAEVQRAADRLIPGRVSPSKSRVRL